MVSRPALLLFLSAALAGNAGAFSPVLQAPPLGVGHPLDSDLLRSQIGAGAASQYSFNDEHQLFCPSTGQNRGFLCTVEPPAVAKQVGDIGAKSASNIPHSIVSHVGVAGSVAAALESQNWGQCFYLADEAVVQRCSGLPDAVPRDWLEEARAAGKCIIYAVNTSLEKFSASSDVYVATPEDERGNAWRLSVDYRVAHINPSLFPSAVPSTPRVRFAGVDQI
uniref:Uncharacterized protein n=1 Tax=Trieres chinensis TaxID=1514140 RepID=A0A7S2A2X2_TRICV|mmetsp:Transcript_38705/g.78964  ORF Transcript_38705/g.78964 Transcript_38705/m.78964 type:complete len:222 (+) Transcript_38705:225-890(+)